MRQPHKETHWSRFAADFDAGNDYVIGKANMALILDEVARQTALGKTLELACGSGIYSLVLAQEAGELNCTDWSEEMVEATRSKLHALPHVTVERANCFDLPYPGDHFDTVFVANLLHILSEPEKAVAEARRVLKPGGTFIALDFTFDGMTVWRTLGLMWRYVRTYGLPQSQRRDLSLQALCTLLENGGLAIQAAELIGDTVKAAYVIAKVGGTR
jgi:ubiquinone/menaquinone biosynthesis C-methylase UbiE